MSKYIKKKKKNERNWMEQTERDAKHFYYYLIAISNTPVLLL
jgi:hypothetical protein